MSTICTNSYEQTNSIFILPDESILNIQMFDCAGQERYRAINLSLLKKADSIVLVYDITKRRSFELCKNEFIPKIKENCKNNIKGILIGNKTDLERDRKISFQEGKKLALSNNYFFFETSCLVNKNVFQAFNIIIKCTDKDMDDNARNNTIVLKKDNIKKRRKSCC